MQQQPSSARNGKPSSTEPFPQRKRTLTHEQVYRLYNQIAIDREKIERDRPTPEELEEHYTKVLGFPVAASSIVEAMRVNNVNQAPDITGLANQVMNLERTVNKQKELIHLLWNDLYGADPIDD